MPGRVIGIDFGTSNTIVACINPQGRADALMLGQHYLVPTVLYFETEKKWYFGKQAADRGLQNPEACIRNFKTDFPENEKVYIITAENGRKLRMTPLKVACLFLNSVLTEAQNALTSYPGCENDYIEYAIVTVPAKFPLKAKQLIKDAISNALPQLNARNTNRIMAEPTAAAVAHITRYTDMINKTVMVYDFGGGTFDISVLSNRNGVFDVRRNETIILGGNDLTRCIIKDLIERINSDYRQDFPASPEEYNPETCSIPKEKYLKTYALLWETAERIKTRLSDGEEIIGDMIAPVTISIDGQLRDIPYTYSYPKDFLEHLLEPEISRTTELVAKVLKEEEDKGNKIDYLVLAGGSSQLPMVKQKLEEIKNCPVIHPDSEISTLIARGAIYSAPDSAQEYTVREIGIPVSSGAVRNRFQTIIQAGQSLPCSGEVVNTIIDGRKELIIKLYEREPRETYEDDSVSGADYIAEWSIPDLPDSPGRTARIMMTANSEGTVDISVDIEVNGKVISKNHTCRRESNLLDV